MMDEQPTSIAKFAVSQAVNDVPANNATPITAQDHGLRNFLNEKLPSSVALIVVLASTVLLVGGWFMCSYLFTQIDLGNTSVAAHQSDYSLEQEVKKRTDHFEITLQYPNKKAQSYPLHEIGLQADSKASVLAIRKKQKAFMQRLFWWRPIEANLTIHADSAKLTSFISNQANVIYQPSKDATIGLSNGTVQLTEAEPGKAFGLIRPETTLMQAASTLSPLPLQLKTLSINPSVTSTSLASSKHEIDKTLNQNVTFMIAGKKITPKPSDIANWLEVGPDKSNKKITVSVNSGKVLEYINKAAKPYVHPPKAQVEILGSDGAPQVLVPGQPGVDVLDKTTVATNVSKELLKGTGLQIDLPIKSATFQTVTAGDYPKWIEVDLTNKRMYAYEHANLQKTFLVTAGAPATPTVLGQYTIQSKRSQQDMRGRNVDGSRYFQPHVPWVNYFYQDYAIHGNYWRPSSYFGNINSSHGCVSVIPSEAAWIYNWAPVGTPVIIHK